MRKELVVRYFNQQSNFCGVILTFECTSFSSALMAKRFPLQIGHVKKRVAILMFLGRKPLKIEFEDSKPQTGTCTKQNTSFKLLNVRIGPELRPVGEMRKLKKGERKSQNRDISPLCGDAPCESISIKFDMFVGLTNIITYTKNGFKISIGFSRTTGGKTHFSL